MDANELSWLAIRQPSVIRLLERELLSEDGDALAAGLLLACDLFGEASAQRGQVIERLTQTDLAQAKQQVSVGAARPHTLRWVFDRLRGLPLVLTRDEESKVATAIATIAAAMDN